MYRYGQEHTNTILFISTREESVEEVKQALGRRLGTYRLHWVSQADLAPGRAADLAPDVILVDDNLSPADPFQLIRQLLLRAPQSAILLMVSMDTIASAGKAVVAGARGFVAKPLQHDDLVNTIQMVLSQGPAAGVAQSADGRVIVFAAPKGGTGRTTLAANTAVALASATKRGVAIVDADYLTPAIDVVLNLKSDHQVTELLAQMPGLDDELLEGVLVDHVSGVRALLTPVAGLPEELPSVPEAQEIIVHLRRMCDWVVVDVGTPLDETAFAYMDAADRIVLNIAPEMISLRNTRHMLDLFGERGYSEQKVWLVVSRSPSQGAIPKASIEEALGVPVVYQIPDDQALAQHSINRGVPYLMSHPRSALGRTIRGFAQALVSDVASGQAQAMQSRAQSAAPFATLGATPDDARDAARVGAQPQGASRAERGWLAKLLGRAQARVMPSEAAHSVEASPALAPSLPQQVAGAGGWTAEERQAQGSDDGGEAGSQAAEPHDGATVSPQDAQELGAMAAQPRGLDLSDSLLIEACPYLGLPDDAQARYPYPCGANQCLSAGLPSPVDPSYQSSICFGGNWTPCPRFVAAVQRQETPDSSEDTSPEEIDQTDEGSFPGDRDAAAAELVPEPDALAEPIGVAGTSRPAEAVTSPHASEIALSRTFVLQSCPYLGLRDDDSARLPYPDAANCCHARGLPRAVEPDYQMRACFGGEWAECPQFQAGLSDSFFLESGSGGYGYLQEETARDAPGDDEPPPSAVGESGSVAASMDGPSPRPEPALDAARGAGDVAAALLPEAHHPTSGSEPTPEGPDADELDALMDERCIWLGLHDAPQRACPYPDTSNHCHSGSLPYAVRPSYQRDNCLGYGWRSCPRYRTEAPKALPVRERLAGSVVAPLPEALDPEREPARATARGNGALPTAGDGQAPAPSEEHDVQRPPAAPADGATPWWLRSGAPLTDLQSDAGTDDGASAAETCLTVHEQGPDPVEEWGLGAALSDGLADAPAEAECPDREAGHAELAEIEGVADEAEDDDIYEPEPLTDVLVCPLLGLIEEPENHLDGPDRANRCFASGEPGRVGLGFQCGTCLHGVWPACPRFLACAAALDAQEAAGSDVGVRVEEPPPPAGAPRTPPAVEAAPALADPQPPPVEVSGPAADMPATGALAADPEPSPLGGVPDRVQVEEKVSWLVDEPEDLDLPAERAAPAAGRDARDAAEARPSERPSALPPGISWPAWARETTPQETEAPQAEPAEQPAGVPDDGPPAGGSAQDHRWQSWGSAWLGRADEEETVAGRAPESPQEWATEDPWSGSAGGPSVDAPAQQPEPPSEETSPQAGLGLAGIRPNVCPYLGSWDDPDVVPFEPDKQNYCHTRATPFPVVPAYQTRICFATNGESCKRFADSLRDETRVRIAETHSVERDREKEPVVAESPSGKSGGRVRIPFWPFGRGTR